MNAKRELLAGLTGLVGARYCLSDDAARERFEVDHRRLYFGRAAAVVLPGTREELAAVVGYCAAHEVAMVPQGGNTGYCGGATPDTSGTQVVVATERLNRLIEIDPLNQTLTVEAGMTLADAQALARDHDLLLPLSMGSEGSCRIGGNLATNAGGLAVLRYGTARDLCLGVEAITASGERVNELRGLRKDNTGYHLSGLLVGAEGTLGIISAATLRLFPLPHSRHAVFAAVKDVDTAATLLRALQGQLGDTVTSFEYLSGGSVALSLAAGTMAPPLAGAHAHCVLFEWVAFDATGNPAEAALENLMGEGLIEDAVLAHNETQRRALWSLREGVPAAERLAGGSIKHDISVRIGDLGAFIERARALVGARWPQARLSVYGHIGDGNVHFNVLAPQDVDPGAFLAREAAAISDGLHALAHEFDGSFSAEHGVGQAKRELLARYTDAPRLAAMRALKAALDPRGLMNPGKVL